MGKLTVQEAMQEAAKTLPPMPTVEERFATARALIAFIERVGLGKEPQ